MEANNMAAMREALQQALYFLRRHHMGAVYAPDGETLIYCEDVADIVAKALFAPPRQCDIGDVDEQERRYRASTDDAYHTLTLTNVLKWTQMPYAEGADEGKGQQGDKK